MGDGRLATIRGPSAADRRSISADVRADDLLPEDRFIYVTFGGRLGLCMTEQMVDCLVNSISRH